MFLIVSLLGTSTLLNAQESRYAGKTVEFQFRPLKKAENVYLVGQFNGWDKGKTPLSKGKDGRTWSVSLPIAPGVYQYKFVIDGKEWVPDNKAPKIEDGNGNLNSLLVVSPKEYDLKPGKTGDGILTQTAFLHDPNSRDLARKDSDRFITRFRTRKSDVAAVTVQTFLNGKSQGESALSLTHSDPLYDYWQGEIPAVATEYRFRVGDGSAEFFFGATGAHSGTEVAPFPIFAASYPFLSVPEWVQDTVFYQIFPERFENGDAANDPADVQPWGSKPTGSNRMGGDIAGVSKRMGYLESLGINGIYFNPLFASGSNHGYDTYDYERVDPRFGTNNELKTLIAKAHERNWRVILDGVFNHTGTEYPAFKSLRTLGAESPYREWYFIKRFPLEVKDGQTTYEGWFGVPSMPKLNVMNPAVKTHLMGVATKWLTETKADGWRLDAADEIVHPFWKEFRAKVKSANPNAFILGEIWGDATEWMKGDEFDSVMNYRWRQLALDFFCYKKLTTKRFDEELTRLRTDYQPASQNGMFNLLGSHDTERLTTLFLREASRSSGEKNGEKDRKTSYSNLLKMTVLFQMSYPGTPCIYYGDEVGLEGGRDPDERRCMDWTEKSWDENLLAFYQKSVALRQTHPALRRGEYRTLFAEKGKGLFGFVRNLADKTRREKIVVLFNRSSRPMKATIPKAELGNGKLKELMRSGGNSSNPTDGASVELGAYEAIALSIE